MDSDDTAIQAEVKAIQDKLKVLDKQKDTILHLNSDSDWSSKKSTLIKFVFEVEAQLSQAQQSIYTLSSQNKTLINELNRVNKHKASLLADLRQCKGSTEELSKTLGKLDTNFEAVEGSNQALRRENRELLSNLEEAEKHLKEQILVNKDILRENEVLSIEIKRREIEIEELTEDNIILTSREKELNDMLTELEIKNDTLKSRFNKGEISKPTKKSLTNSRLRKFKRISTLVDRMVTLEGSQKYLQEKMGSDIINRMVAGMVSDSCLKMVERNICTFESMTLKRRVRSQDCASHSLCTKQKKSASMLNLAPVEDSYEEHLLRSNFRKIPWKTSFDSFNPEEPGKFKRKVKK